MQNIQLELGTTPADLQALVSQARGEDEEDVVYAFFIDNVQITRTLGESIYEQGRTLE